MRKISIKNETIYNYGNTHINILDNSIIDSRLGVITPDMICRVDLNGKSHIPVMDNATGTFRFKEIPVQHKVLFGVNLVYKTENLITGKEVEENIEISAKDKNGQILLNFIIMGLFSNMTVDESVEEILVDFERIRDLHKEALEDYDLDYDYLKETYKRLFIKFQYDLDKIAMFYNLGEEESEYVNKLLDELTDTEESDYYNSYEELVQQYLVLDFDVMASEIARMTCEARE